MNDGFLSGLSLHAYTKGGIMPCVCLLLLVAVLGCGAVDMRPIPQGTQMGEEGPSAESLVGTVGETSLVEEGVGQHPRRIIYTASIELIVEEFEGVPGKVAELAEKFGGYVASSSIQGQPGSPRLGTWTLRVPIAQYANLLSEANELGELRSLTSNSQDVSEEYYNVLSPWLAVLLVLCGIGSVIVLVSRRIRRRNSQKGKSPEVPAAAQEGDKA